MIYLETARLHIFPLEAHRLSQWLHDLPALEKDLSLSYQGESLDGFLGGIVEKQLLLTEEHPEEFVWHSFWLILRKEDRVVVGSTDFKGLPDKDGHVEIGYGLGKAFEHHGYMTEAVSALCTWGLSQPGVRGILAETETENQPSQRVLQRCGFSLLRKADTLWWIKEPSSQT